MLLHGREKHGVRVRELRNLDLRGQRPAPHHWSRPVCLGIYRRNAIKLENEGIAVRDLEASNADIAMLQTPDGQGLLELVEYIHPRAIESNPMRIVSRLSGFKCASGSL